MELTHPRPFPVTVLRTKATCLRKGFALCFLHGPSLFIRSIGLISLQPVDHRLGVLGIGVFRSKFLEPDVLGLQQVFQCLFLLSLFGVTLADVVVAGCEVRVVGRKVLELDLEALLVVSGRLVDSIFFFVGRA